MSRLGLEDRCMFLVLTRSLAFVLPIGVTELAKVGRNPISSFALGTRYHDSTHHEESFNQISRQCNAETFDQVCQLAAGTVDYGWRGRSQCEPKKFSVLAEMPTDE